MNNSAKQLLTCHLTDLAYHIRSTERGSLASLQTLTPQTHPPPLRPLLPVSGPESERGKDIYATNIIRAFRFERNVSVRFSARAQ